MAEWRHEANGVPGNAGHHVGIIVDISGVVSAATGVPYRRAAKNPSRKRVQGWLDEPGARAFIYTFGERTEQLDIAPDSEQLDAILRNYIGGGSMTETRMRAAGWPHRAVFTAEVWISDADDNLPTVIVFHLKH
jgi:hypothetical protein